MMRDRGIHYNPNGGGRDTYIYNDNGGFGLMKEPREQFHPATVYPDAAQLHKFSKTKQPVIHSKPVKYP